MRIFFLHIHKTAGTSITNSISHMYDCEKICPFNFEYQFYEKCYQLSDFSKYDFFRGHFGLNVKNNFFADAKVISFVREPLDRLKSLYIFFKNQANNSDISDTNKHNVGLKVSQMSFKEFIFSTDKSVENIKNNVQSKLLGGGYFSHKKESRPEVIVNDDDFFENAINFVNHRDNIVGASDNIKPVFEKLNSNFTNILPEPDYLKVSPIIDKEQLVIDDELIEHMNKINYFDYLLYNYIKRLWIFL